MLYSIHFSLLWLITDDIEISTSWCVRYEFPGFLATARARRRGCKRILECPPEGNCSGATLRCHFGDNLRSRVSKWGITCGQEWTGHRLVSLVVTNFDLCDSYLVFTNYVHFNLWLFWRWTGMPTDSHCWSCCLVGILSCNQVCVTLVTVTDPSVDLFLISRRSTVDSRAPRN